MLKLIPFQADWLAHETLDLHAIYRRPKRDMETGELVRDEFGFVQWDLTTPLPMRSHAKFLAKGFEYVTLATSADVISASDPELAAHGVAPLHDPREYLDQARDRGPWDATKYLADMKEAHAERLRKLKARIEQAGPEVAEEFEQQHDPGFILPASLTVAKRGPGRPKKDAVAA